MKTFEDLGFVCLDNAPPVLVPAFVALAEGNGADAAAVAFDVRSGGAFGDANEIIDRLAADGRRPEVLYLDADDAALVRRYSETRRRHPLTNGRGTLVDAIDAERASLAPLRARADVVWNTSAFTLAALKEHVAERFTASGAATTRLEILAFGYKHGVPLDADWVFDVRFLPNPHYVPELRPLDGTAPRVGAFLEAADELAPFLERLFALVDFVVPRARSEGKSRLTFAICCTGGRHRSIYVAHRLAQHLRNAGEAVEDVIERDLRR